jgi:hypothetical protein
VLGDAVNVLTSADLLGPRPADPASLPSVTELESMVGLASVKRAVRSLLGLMRENAAREDAEAPPLRICLHRLFLGPPGTGKTTVAALYGRILKDMGWLSKGDLVLRTPADFTGTVVGESGVCPILATAARLRFAYQRVIHSASVQRRARTTSSPPRAARCSSSTKPTALETAAPT